MKQLIVNADDFGLTSGVNRAVVELHAEGVLTSSTLMARAAATEEAIEIARSTPSLGVGCHVVLVDGASMLSASRDVPHLANPRTGQFRQSLGGFLADLYASRGSSRYTREMEAEARAQIEYLQSRGLHLTHVDAHKHTHMFPKVLRPVLRAARAAGIRKVRNPFEPAWAVRATAGASWARIAEVSLLRWLKPVWQRILVEEGFTTTDGTIAVVGTGVLNAEMLRSLVARLPHGTWELVTHPGYNDADLARVPTRLRASRDVERGALSTLKEFPDVDLISFHHLPQPAPLPAKI